MLVLDQKIRESLKLKRIMNISAALTFIQKLLTYFSPNQKDGSTTQHYPKKQITELCWKFITQAFEMLTSLLFNSESSYQTSIIFT